MIMEPRAGGFSGSLRAFRFDDETLLPCPDHQLMKFSDGVRCSGPSLDLGYVNGPFLASDCEAFNSGPSPPTSIDGDSPIDDHDFSETMFKYINQMLLEEDMDDRSTMSHDPLALEATEKSLYEVISEKHPSEQNLSPLYMDSPDIIDSYSGSSNCSDSCGQNSSSGGNSIDTVSVGKFVDSMNSFPQAPIPENFIFESSTVTANVQPHAYVPNPFTNDMNGVIGSVKSGSESMVQFQRGLEEARRFLPKNYQIFLDFADASTLSGLKDKSSLPAIMVEKDGGSNLPPNGFKGKKNHEREDTESEEERSNKQSAVYVDETELSEMFDNILLCHNRENGEPSKEKPLKGTEQNEHADVAKGEKVRSKKPGSNKTEAVDLRALLTLCAQAVSTDDRRTAEDYIRQIRQHSSPSGNGSQRLAHCFVNALEARLSGTGTQIYAALDSKKMFAVDILKAYQLYRSACPFQKLTCIFANHNILSLAEKATTLHIIDFGILYGFQWPPLIFRLSKRAGGPPKLRITGIELPQRGFRPAERVQATGQWLAKYCERFGVPFEYNAIAKKWEMIRMEDLKLGKNETIAVNTLFRFNHLLDQTVVVNNPRDTVLNLIRKIKPDIFVQAIVNASFNAPFFLTRFREALFHYSSMFDAFDNNISQDDPVRLMYEKEFFGREAINIIACEGLERVERPETYKQWQIRTMRAGFKQLPLDSQLMRKLRLKLKEGYDVDFVVDEDGHWMLQGWKGRILFASSGWVPM